VITIRTTQRNGPVVGVAQVVDDDEVMLITDGGKVLRCPVSGISTMGRATQGVRVMDLAPSENVVSMARLAESDVAEPDVAEPDVPVSDVSERDVGGETDGDGSESSS
jgi:DNA gyrase subunit A